MTSIVTRPKWFDFQKVTLEDLKKEQNSYLAGISDLRRSTMGSGIELSFPEEPVLFDSNNLTLAQSGYIGTNTFDGRGVLDTPYLSTDLNEGNQISISVENLRLDGILSMTVTLIGKLFDDSLVYEHVTFTNNGFKVTRNLFKEVTNIFFQNFKGNLNTTIDGQGSFNLGGTVKMTEASSMKVSLDLLSADYTYEPDIIFRDFKPYDAGKTLSQVIVEGIGASNDINDLNIRTTGKATRSFSAGASTDIIYGEKFLLKSATNIQKITMLLALDSGTSWSGDIVVEIRPLQTSTSCSTAFLPDSAIGFDPDTVPLESISLNQAGFAALGVELDSTYREVDFVFSNTNISNPGLSLLNVGGWYVITIRRTGDTATGTISLEEASNDNPLLNRLTVFQSGQWTDVPDSSLWYQVWSDSVKVSSGTAFDEGTKLSSPKTIVNNNGVRVQRIEEDFQLVNTAEGAENYITVRKDITYSDPVSHPATGDQIFSTEQDSPKFEFFEQNAIKTLLKTEPELNVIARVIDNNSRSNPVINDTLDFPALAIGNTINIINPSTDFLTQNVVGSTITPNLAKPSIKYRIISQEIIIDTYGDMDSDSVIDITDANRVAFLDGYSPSLSLGSIPPADQLQYVMDGYTSVPELLRGDVDNTGLITPADFSAVTSFILNGTAFPAGSTFTRVVLTVEPLLDPKLSLDANGRSTLKLEVVDPDLINNTAFVVLNLQVDFVTVWDPSNIEILDLRRFSNTTFNNFSEADLTSSPETGGENNFFVPGNMYLGESILEKDGTFHPLDYERNVVELEMPQGNTEGRLNIFTQFVVGKMHFSDGTLVSSNAILENQVKFEVSIGSHVKNLDGYDFDGYNDGYGTNAEEALGAYMEHNSGILRFRVYNVVRNEFFPELRTRLIVVVSLKKAGFKDKEVLVSSSDLLQLIEPIT